MPTLTIAIPTFNRNAALVAQVSRLLPQLHAETELIILDNCSDRPVSHDVANVIKESATFAYRHVRHRANLGVNANVLRAIELSEGGWLWILSDDDPVLPDAVATVLGLVRDAEEEVRYINFSSDDFSRNTAFRTVGMEDYVNRLDHFGHALLISSGIYRTAPVQTVLREGYDLAYSCCLQIALVLRCLNLDGVCLWRHEKIVEWVMPSIENRWNMVRVAVRSPCLLDLEVLDSGSRSTLAKKIQAFLPHGGTMWMILQVRVRRGMPKSDAITIFHEYATRHASERFYWWERIGLYFARLSFSMGVYFMPMLFQAFYRLRGRAFEHDAAILPLDHRF